MIKSCLFKLKDEGNEDFAILRIVGELVTIGAVLLHSPNVHLRRGHHDKQPRSP